MPEKYLQKMNDAVRFLQIADHMAYVTFPLLNEKRLLLKIFDEIYYSIVNLIEAVIEYDFLYKRISNNSNSKIETFFTKCAKRYEITNEQLKKIREIIEVHSVHMQSPMEFVKKEKVVILSETMQPKALDITKIKEYLLAAKQVLLKVKNSIEF